ncbi:MAG: DUF742 domain-containing protein [Actinomycetota bacterium]|nr:DUF742 domain-containing protein [Actinomycetota bacterium]
MSESSRDDGDEQSFAGLVNDLSGGPWRAGGRRKRSARSSATPQPPAVDQQRPAQQQPTSVAAVPVEWSRPAASASVVRPYTWTGGRTAPVIDLAVETLVSTSDHGHDVAVLTSEEHRAVAELCHDPRSVAEVAALLSLPLGVVRVLLADMADIGLVVVHRSASGSSNMPDVALMERVLSGLRRL